MAVLAQAKLKLKLSENCLRLTSKAAYKMYVSIISQT